MKQPLQVRAILALVLVAVHHSLACGPLAAGWA